MKQITILFGVSLMIIIVYGIKTDAYGQQCCNYGTWGFHSVMANWGCQQSSTEYCGYDECTLCNYSDFTQCINNGDTWYPSSCSCTLNCSDNSLRAQNCMSQQGMIWNSSTCSCNSDPYYGIDPCDYVYTTYDGSGAGYCDFYGTCSSCSLACGWFYCGATITYYWSSLTGQLCDTSYVSSDFPGCINAYECDILCYMGCY